MPTNTNTTVASPTAGKSSKVGIIVVALDPAVAGKKGSKKSTQACHLSKMALFFVIKIAEVRYVRHQGYLVIIGSRRPRKKTVYKGIKGFVRSSVFVGEPVIPSGRRKLDITVERRMEVPPLPKSQESR